MKIELTESFIKDIERASDRKLAARVFDVVTQIQSISKPTDITHLKKLKNAPNAFRIRVGEYRIGVLLESDTIVFVRCLPRKDIYRLFP